MRRGVVAAVAVALVAGVVAGAVRLGDGGQSASYVSGPLAAGSAGAVQATDAPLPATVPRIRSRSVRMVRAAGPARRTTLARASHPLRLARSESEIRKPPVVTTKPIAPSVAYRARSAGTPAVGTRIQGLNSTQGQADPPDVQVAAGPTAIVEMVNTVYAMWSRAGVLLDSGQLDAFFTSSGVNRKGDEVTDPRVVYDTSTGRWFAALFDVTRGEALVGVSDTSDPTGDWGLVAFDFQDPKLGGTCPDQPRLGLSDAVVVVGVDLFANCEAGDLKGGVAIVFDKQEMLTGETVSITAYGGRSTAFTQITPAVSLGPTQPDYLVSVRRDKPGVIFLYTAISPDVESLPFVRLRLTKMDPPPNAPQKGTRVRLDTGDDRVQNARWENGLLTFVASDACRPAAVTLACGRVAQIDTVTTKVAWEKELVLGGGRYLFYPVLESDGAGNLLLAFGYSSGTEYPGVGAVTVQPDRSFSSWTLVQKGAGSHYYRGLQIPRYGDYFGIGRDPVVPGQVWAAAEFGSGLQGHAGWGTTIFAVTTGSANPPPPPPPDQTRPTVKPRAATVTTRAAAKLYFTLHDKSGSAQVAGGVYRGSKRVTSFGSQEVTNGTWFLKWRAPTKRAVLEFCLVAVDAAGNKSKTACAPVRVT